MLVATITWHGKVFWFYPVYKRIIIYKISTTFVAIFAHIFAPIANQQYVYH